LNAFPPGSHSLGSDEDWHRLGHRFPSLHGFIYGSNESAVVYTYDAGSQVLSIELIIRDGQTIG
jgi:hypothetical protein